MEIKSEQEQTISLTAFPQEAFFGFLDILSTNFHQMKNPQIFCLVISPSHSSEPAVAITHPVRVPLLAHDLDDDSPSLPRNGKQ